MAQPLDAPGERGAGSRRGPPRSSPRADGSTHPTAAALPKRSADGRAAHCLPQQSKDGTMGQKPWFDSCVLKVHYLLPKLPFRLLTISLLLYQIPTCLQEFEGVIYSATCWLDEAQTWLRAPCCFTTARHLQNHANSLQVRNKA